MIMEKSTRRSWTGNGEVVWLKDGKNKDKVTEPRSQTTWLCVKGGNVILFFNSSTSQYLCGPDVNYEPAPLQAKSDVDYEAC